MNKLLVACSLVAAISCLPGCAGGLSEMCAKALPVMTKSNSLATDASIALENAADVITRSTSLSPDQKAEAQVKIETARVALQAASSALALVKDTCQAQDVASIFKDFLAAWATIRPFLALLGNTGAGGVVLSDPVVWRTHGGK